MPVRLVESASETLSNHAQRQLDAHARTVFAVVRRVRPVLSLPRVTVVSRHDDVLTVLGDPAGFAATYQSRLPGPFILGTDDPIEHKRQMAMLLDVARPSDSARLVDLVRRESQSRIDRALATGRIDVGADLIRPVLSRVAAEYLGTPGPTEEIEQQWARNLFQHIFLNPGNIASIRRRSDLSAAQLLAHVQHLLEARRSAPRPHPDDGLTRQLELQRQAGSDLDDLNDSGEPDDLDDLAICWNLIGLAIAWLGTTEKACTLVIDELCRRPAALEQARSAARAGDAARLQQIILETLRFRSTGAGLLRRCVSDTYLPGGERVRAGTTVFVGTQSAMWDPRAVNRPAEFRTDRPAATYLMFGDSLHRCLGEQIAREQLPALLAPLLALDRVERAPGRAGRLRWDGPFPDGFEAVIG